MAADRWTVDAALKWADTWGVVEAVAPSGDQMAMDALAREVRALRATISRACAGYPDNATSPTCVAILRSALPANGPHQRETTALTK